VGPLGYSPALNTTPDLRLPDFDQLSVGDITHRIRSLVLDDVTRLLEHERSTAGRPQILEILSARVSRLEAGAEPSGGDPSNAPPVRESSTDSSSGPDTAAPATTPRRHGVADQTPKRGRS
jgi:hypothetical protein